MKESPFCTRERFVFFGNTGHLIYQRDPHNITLTCKNKTDKHFTNTRKPSNTAHCVTELSGSMCESWVISIHTSNKATDPQRARLIQGCLVTLVILCVAQNDWCLQFFFFTDRSSLIIWFFYLCAILNSFSLACTLANSVIISALAG